MAICSNASGGCNYPESECSGACCPELTRAAFRQNADTRMPPTRGERAAGVMVAVLIGLLLAASLVAWWSNQS